MRRWIVEETGEVRQARYEYALDSQDRFFYFNCNTDGVYPTLKVTEITEEQPPEKT